MFKRSCHLFAKLCNLFSNKRMPKSETTLQHLPQESVVNILRHLPLTEVVRLEAECTLLNASVLWLFKSEIKTLPARLMREIKVTQGKVVNVPISDEGLRIDYCNALTFLRYMLMETLLLRAAVWRYIENHKTFNLLIQPLSLVLKEFNDTIAIVRDPAINKMVRKEFTKPALMDWEMFLSNFYGHIEDALDAVTGERIPLGVKVVDLMHCSFSANLQSNLVMPYNEDVYAMNVFFDARNGNHSPPPDVDRATLTDDEKLKKVLKHLREVIRSDNRTFINRKTETISALEQRLSNAREDIFEEVIEELRQSYIDILESPFPETFHNQCLIYPQHQEVYSETYFRGENYDTGKTGTVCTLKMVCDKRYLPLDYQSGDAYKQLTSGEPSAISVQQQAEYNRQYFWHCRHYTDVHLSSASSTLPSVDASRNYDMCAFNEFCALNLMVVHDLYYIPMVKQHEVTVSVTKEETVVMAFDEAVLDQTSSDVQL